MSVGFSHGRAAVARPVPPADRDPPPSTRARRIAIAACLFALVPVLLSYLHAIAEPSNSSLGIRSVEWLRDHGAAGLVAKVETIYYEWTAPSKGGPTLRAMPVQGYGVAAARAGGHALTRSRAQATAEAPPPVPAMIHPALPGEGVWRATRKSLTAEPPVLIATLRDQPEYPRVLAGLAYIDTSRATVQLHPGRLEPSVELPRGAMDVPRSARPRLLATFNSGFKLSDAHGGFVLNGVTYAAMRDGMATLVGYRDGRIDVVAWHDGLNAPPEVSFARQNLPLIVDRGRLNPHLGNGPQWGATVGSAVLVWRSGIGVDRRGNLIYAAGPDQTVASLARLLRRAGAVRAMELDINSYWISFIDYGAPGARDPKQLLPDIERSATRYLEPDDRDFFTVVSR